MIAYSSCSGQEQRGRSIRVQKEKQGKDMLGFGENGRCVVREPGRLAAFTLDSLCGSHRPWRMDQTVPLLTTRSGQRLPHRSTGGLLIPFSTHAGALLSHIQTSKTCIALYFLSVGTSKVIPKREGWVMETAPAGSDGKWVLMSVLFWFQLTGLCLGVVSTVQSTRKELKQRKKQTDSEEE